MIRKVEVVPPDRNWYNLFQAESQQLSLALGDNSIAIHHIGSTSIDTIYAKPIIDTAVCGFMGYSYLQKPHSERGREFKVSSICLRTAVSCPKISRMLPESHFEPSEMKISEASIAHPRA